MKEKIAPYELLNEEVVDWVIREEMKSNINMANDKAWCAEDEKYYKKLKKAAKLIHNHYSTYEDHL